MTTIAPQSQVWASLTARSALLCRADPARWRACADRSDELEAAGVPPEVAVQQALEEFGG